jgi:hypothetical protein
MSGIEVIVIPELECRINVLDPIRHEIDPQKSDQIVYATILNRELAFQVVSIRCPQLKEIVSVIRWYSFHKTFAKQVA